MPKCSKFRLSSWYDDGIIAVLLLSFSSALPLILVGSTLQVWYTTAGVNMLTIGMLTLVGQPYVYKFLWAPFMDRYAPLTQDRRRGWILITQFLLVVGLSIMAFLTPDQHPWVLASLALCVAFFSASQDIGIDAYRVDILTAKTRGIGAVMTNLGARAAVLTAGAMAMILADRIGWRATYLIMSGCIALCFICTMLSPSPPNRVDAPKSLQQAFIEPLNNILKRKHITAILLFIILYKIGDAFAFSLNTVFLIRGLGFSLLEIGLIYKVVSLSAVLVGGILGGVLMQRLGLYRALLYFGVLQAVANLAYMALAIVGKNYVVMALSVFAEYFCSGLGTVAFIAYHMTLCDKRYSASQYAMLSALMALGRVYVGPAVAMMVHYMGWSKFFFVTFLMGLPGVFLLIWMKKRVTFDSLSVIGE